MNGELHKNQNPTHYRPEFLAEYLRHSEYTVIQDGELFTPSETKVRYRGRYANPTERSDLVEDPAANDVTYMENSDTWHLHDGSSWSNTGSQEIPVIQSDLSVEPDPAKGSILDDWRFATPQNWVDAARFGVSEFNQDNNAALVAALEYGAANALPVLIRPSIVGYRVVGDIVISGGFVSLFSMGSNATLNFVDGGLMFDGAASTVQRQWDHHLDKITLTRKGTVGPAVFIRAIPNQNVIRWGFGELRITESTGHGIQLEGTYLCGINSLWVFNCEGNGVHIETGTNANSYAGLGANALHIGFGEIQNCAWGIYSSDLKVLSSNTLTVEGCDDGGIWIHRDNESVVINSLYCENNAKNRPYDAANPLQDEMYTDVYIGDPDPSVVINRCVKIHGGRFSDGSVGQRRAVFIENGQREVVVDSVSFHAYSGPPVRLIGPDIDDGAGGVIKGVDNPSGDSNTTTTGYVTGCHRRDGGGTVDGRILANTARPLGFVDRSEMDRLDSIFTVSDYAPTVSLEAPGDSIIVVNNYDTRYHRHGQLVHFSIILNFTPTIGTGSGDLLISMPPVPSQQAFPFPVNVTNHSRFAGPNGAVSMYGNVDGPANAIRLGWTRDDATTTQVDEAHLSDGVVMRIELSGFYMTEAV